MGMFDQQRKTQNTYKYTRGMRDGSTKEFTAVIRSRSKAKKPIKEEPNG
jgi:hypothetical protein